ncbi:transposase [Saccharopolyspora sp. ASAGF58]|nr:transposase [Saccharopolyspora sp. ASAGF58]
MPNSGRLARRSGYPSDTSDEQWALIEPLLPEVKTGGRPEKHPAAHWWTRSSMWCAPDSRGGNCRPTSRPGRPCTGTSTAGNSTRSPSRSSRWCVHSCGSPKAVTRSPAQG